MKMKEKRFLKNLKRCFLNVFLSICLLSLLTLQSRLIVVHLFYQNAAKNSLLQKASDEQKKADESVMKLAEDQKVRV